MRARLLVRTLVTLVALALTAGCAGIGTTSPVAPGLPVAGADAPRVRVFFPGPVNDATPEQIIRGFIRSGASSDGDYDTARSFLTPDAGKAWLPEGEILIFANEGDVAIRMVDEATATVSVPVVARISAEGRYAAAPAGDTQTVTFRFARIDEQWRIASLPDDFARWLTAPDVRRLVQPYAIHYVAHDRRTLVQDLRWFPLDHLTSRLARAQLAPVPASLSGVATTAVPSGARLAADSVSVVQGVATVDLSTRLPADQVLRQNLWAQLVATLTQDVGVLSVALQVDGSPIEPPGTSVPVSDASQLGFTTSTTSSGPVLVRRGDRLWTFDVDGPVGNQEPSTGATARQDLPAIGAAWGEVAVSPDLHEVAATTRDGATVARWRGGDRFDLAPLAAPVARPVFDARGFLWLALKAPAAGGAAIRAISLLDPPATAPVHEVTADWLTGKAVLALKVSPDGERVAVLVAGEEGRPRLLVAGIVRGALGLPTGLAEPVEIGATIGPKSALVWLGPTTLAALAASDQGAVRPWVLSLDGTAAALPETPGAVDLTSPSTDRRLVVLDSGGHLLTRAGQLWLSAGTASEVLVPGR